MALTMHEEAKCGGCGHYADEAWDPDADGWYEADASTVCAACAARERHVKDETSHEPGQMLRVYDARIEGELKSVRRAPGGPKPEPAPTAAPRGESTVG